MLKLTDHGCNEHQWRQLLLSGSEAELIRDMLVSLPREGNFYTFICQHGHTHRLSYLVQTGRMVNA